MPTRTPQSPASEPKPPVPKADTIKKSDTIKSAPAAQVKAALKAVAEPAAKVEPVKQQPAKAPATVPANTNAKPQADKASPQADKAPPQADKAPAPVASKPAPSAAPVPSTPVPSTPVATAKQSAAATTAKPQPIKSSAAKASSASAPTGVFRAFDLGATSSEFGAINRTVVEFVRSESEAAMAHLTKLSAVRSPGELVKLQVGEFQRAADASLSCFGTVARSAGRIAGFR